MNEPNDKTEVHLFLSRGISLPDDASCERLHCHMPPFLFSARTQALFNRRLETLPLPQPEGGVMAA
jgi:hypothetical protein